MNRTLKLALSTTILAAALSPASAENGFERLRGRIEAERLERAAGLDAMIRNFAEPARDVLEACPELDARTFARRPVGEAASLVQACLSRALPGAEIDARPGVIPATAAC
jgi:hypothetical protein